MADHALTDAVRLTERYQSDTGRNFLTGINAVVRVPVVQMRLDRRAGLRTEAFVSGYPGSPLGTLDREFLRQQRLLASLGIVHQPAVNEELAATAIFGSQAASASRGFRPDGVLGVWYGKAPGLDRAADAVRHGNIAGTSPGSGVLVFVGDDPACKSSSLPSASEGLCTDLGLPVLHPGSVQDVLDLGRHAVALSRVSGLWTALKIVTVVADGNASVDLDAERVNVRIPPGLPPAPPVGTRLHQPYSLELQRDLMERRLPSAQAYGALNELNRVTVDAADAWLGVVAPGHLYGEVLEAFKMLGLTASDLTKHGIRLFQVRMPFPMDPAGLRRFATGLREILVIEEHRTFVETHVRDALYRCAGAPLVTGKLDSDGATLVPAWGALDADRIAEPLLRRLSTRIDPERLRRLPGAVGNGRTRLPVLPARTPWFCAGCPHSTSTHAPAGALVGTGIGCHALASRMDPDRTGTVLSNTQMGGEGAQWVGAAPFLEDDHLFQNLGDGTLFHSGWLAIRFAVAAGPNITFKILYNGAVSMTGGQDPVGMRSVPDLVQGLKAEGVGRIIVTTEDVGRYREVRLPAGVDVWDRRRIVDAQSALAAERGVTVLIHDQRCAAELRRDRKRGRVPMPAHRIVIDERVCEGCGDCGKKSACLAIRSVETDFGAKAAIDQAACNLDLSCLEGDCPSFTLVTPRRARRWSARRNRTGAAPVAPAPPLVPVGGPTLPQPQRSTHVDEFVIRMPGIGGTGVVTVAQILAVAATLDGYSVSGLDQTGLSQKSGPVVSDLRIFRGDEVRPGRASSRGVDLVLAFDALVGLTPEFLVGLVPDRTVVVGSTSGTPTGAMIGHHDGPPDSSAAIEALTPLVRSSTWVEAEQLTREQLGDATPSNVFLVGIAYQLGVLPVSAASIENALEQNGVAVALNLAAFRAGRAFALSPPKPTAHIESTCGDLSEELQSGLADLRLPPALRDFVALRVADLIRYQDDRYAARYLETVTRVARSGSSAFTRAAAANLYKLMAYKDEYEVARLHLRPEAQAAAEAVAGPEARRTLMLHPPVLRWLGVDRKLKFGPRARPVLQGIAALKRMRGTPFDIFGFTRLRRVERQLIREYEALLERLADRFDTVGEQTAVSIAALPDLIRGYEAIKLAAVDDYRARLQRELAALPS